MCPPRESLICSTMQVHKPLGRRDSRQCQSIAHMKQGSVTNRMRTVVSLAWQTCQKIRHLSDQQCPGEEGSEVVSSGMK